MPSPNHSACPSRRRPLVASASPFVGRQAELDLLTAQLDEARRGHGRLTVVAGEPGIGKTRLLTELAARAQATGSLALLGHAYDSAALPPYYPFIEPLRGYLRTLDADCLRARLGGGAAQVALLLPELRAWLPELTADAGAGPQPDRLRTFDAVVDLLFAVARATTGGLALVLEDLHWADAASLELVQHLVRRLAEAPLLLVLTYRTVDVPSPHAWPAVLAELSRTPALARLQLRPFAPAETAALIAGLIQAPVAPAAVARVFGETEGNPFFITELVRELHGAGVDLTSPVAVAGSWQAPEAVRQVISSRLSRLGDLTNQLLQGAAVLGERFTFELLGALVGGEAAALLPAFEAALTAGLVQESGEGYDFTHALIRQTIVETLSLPRRQWLHLRAAEAIERVHARHLTPHFAALAGHYRLAGASASPEKAIGYLQRAGAAAQASFAYETAAAQWRAALALMEEDGVDTVRRADLLQQLGTLMQVVGFDHYADAIAYREQALTLYEARGLTERAAQLHAELGSVLASNAETMDIPRAERHLRAAETVLGSGQERVSLANLYVSIATVAVWQAETEAGLSACRRAMAIAERLKNASSWSTAALHCGGHLIASGHPGEGLALMEQAYDRADQTQAALPAYIASTWRGSRAYLLGDPRDAQAWWARELNQPRMAQSPNRRHSILSMLAGAHALAGELGEARRALAEVGSERFDQMAAWFSPPVVAFWAGEWEEAHALWQQVRERHRRAGNRWSQADFACWLARLCQAQGDSAAAEALFHDTLAVGVEGPVVPFELEARTGLALLYVDSGRVGGAQPHLARCREILAGGEDWRGLVGAVQLAAGAVAAALGQQQEAAARFADALQTYRRYTLPWDEAETHHRRGRALLGAGEQRRALDQFEAALAVYDRIGAAERWRERVLADIARVEPRRQPPQPRYPDGLTAREAEVLNLLAAGNSNREVAARLVLSERTVARHITNLYGKIGARNRADAVAYALRHGLAAADSTPIAGPSR